MAKWIEFKKDMPFSPKGKAGHLTDYKAGMTRQVVEEAAKKALEGGFGVEVPAPANREEAKALEGGENVGGRAPKPGSDSKAN